MGVGQVGQAVFARLVHLKMPRPAEGAMRRVRRILFLRHDAVGDMLSSLGVIRTLADAGYEVDVLASPANVSILPQGTWGVRVLTNAPGRAARRALHEAFAGRRYDAVIDGLVLNRRVNSGTLRLLLASRAPVRIGTGHRRHAFVYTHAVSTDLAANHVEVLASLLEPFSLAAERARAPVAMPLTDAERLQADAWWGARGSGARLFVNLSASGPDRRWADAQFAAVLDAVTVGRPGLRIAVTGSPMDWPSARRLAAGSGGRWFTGSVRDAFAVLSRSDAVLTPDTGAVHAAAGFGVPSVVLIPRANLRFAPWRAPGALVVAEGRTIHDIPPSRVSGALGAVLDALPPPGDPRATVQSRST